MAESIREIMESWARYRHYRHGGFGKTMLQRFMEGMPGVHCPTCGGSGRVPGALYGLAARSVQCQTCAGDGRVRLDENQKTTTTQKCGHCKNGEINGRTCIHCRGAGRVTVVHAKANPAFITSTFREPDRPVLQRVDRLVCELRQRDPLRGYYYVIWYEYCDARGGTQEMKAGRVGITSAAYRQRLHRGLVWIEAALPDRRDCRLIPFPYSANAAPETQESC